MQLLSQLLSLLYHSPGVGQQCELGIQPSPLDSSLDADSRRPCHNCKTAPSRMFMWWHEMHLHP